MNIKAPTTAFERTIKEIEDATGRVVVTVTVRPDGSISKYTLGEPIKKKSTEQKPIE